MAALVQMFDESERAMFFTLKTLAQKNMLPLTMISGEMALLISKREKLVHLMAIPLAFVGTLFQGKIGSKSHKKAEFCLYRWSFETMAPQTGVFFLGGGERSDEMQQTFRRFQRGKK